MNIVVPAKLVPDLVEELCIDSSGKALDTTWLRHIINEFDDHAIEQAILFKEIFGGQVTVIAPNVEGVDDMLYAAAARGADKLIRLNGDFSAGINNHAMAKALAGCCRQQYPDLILVGVQAHNDLDGSLGTLLAELLGMPYVGYVSGISLGRNRAILHKEYPGGLLVEMEVSLPAVLGIQAAAHAPRYVALSKVRQVMKTAVIEDQHLASLDLQGGPEVSRMFQPKITHHAAMLEGDVDATASQLVGIFKELGVL